MNRLNDAITELSKLPKNDKVNVKGKLYTQVATRCDLLRKHFGTDANIKTEIIFNDLERVVMSATITVYQDGQWREVANGYAEEFRGANLINKTSAIENCETSAIGRALASLGLSGGEFASSFEVDNAVNNKTKAPDISQEYVLMSPNGAKVASNETIEGYIETLKTVMSKPKEKSCQDHYEANKVHIKKVIATLDEEDANKATLQKVVDIYEVDDL